MSLLIFAIAAVPAAFVLFVADKTRSKSAIVLTATVAAAVGVLTGNPAYLGLDLIFVGIALFIAWNIAKTPLQRTPEEIERRRLERIQAEEAQAKWDKAVNEFIFIALLVGLGVMVLTFKYWLPIVAPMQSQPQPAIQPPASAVTPQARPPQKSAPKPAPAQRQPRSVEQCLKIADESAMVRCLERTP